MRFSGLLGRMLGRGGTAAGDAPKLCPHCVKPLAGRGFCPFCYEYVCADCLRPHVDAAHPIILDCPACGSRGRLRPQLGISVQVPGTDVALTGYCVCTKCGREWSARGERDAR